MWFINIFFLFFFFFFLPTIQGASQWTRWSMMGACSVSCGSGDLWQKRTCIGDGPHPVCRGPQHRVSRCQKLACPVNDCNCGCTLRDKQGDIRSVSPSHKSQDCTWNIVTKPGNVIRLTVNNFLLSYGNLRIVGPNKVYRLVNNRHSRDAQIPFTIQSVDNQLNLTLYYHSQTLTSDHVKLEASYETIEVANQNIKDEDKDNDNSVINIPTVGGISACVFIIILVTCLIIYRRTFNQGKNTTHETEEGCDENCASSTTASLKNDRSDLFWDTTSQKQQQTLLNSDRHKLLQKSDSTDHQRLLSATPSGNVMPTIRINPTATAVPMYMNAGGMNGQVGYGNQFNQPSYILIPQQQQQQQNGGNLINDHQSNQVTNICA